MLNNVFDPDNTLSGALFGISPREAILLGTQICDAVLEISTDDQPHGCICPDNISVTNSVLALGPVSELNVSDMSPSALEYIAPEQFWNGETVPQSDVYSIGLVLYTALNDGVMPFHDERESAQIPEKRAAALQRRMNGEAPAYPKTACRELGDIVLKAISFNKENRYANAAQLGKALAELPESAAIPAVAPVLPLTEDEVRAVKNYKVDKDFEPTEPVKPKKIKKERHVVPDELDVEEFRNPPKKSKTWIFPAAIIVILIIVAIFVLRGCNTDENSGNITLPPVSPSMIINTSPSPSPNQSDENVSDATVSPSPVTESEEPSKDPSYQIFIEDVTWEQAVQKCEDLGGHLVTIRNDAEMERVIALMESTEAKFLWIGAHREQDGELYYVTGEIMTYAVWEEGEPSVIDSNGIHEDNIIMWRSHKSGQWCFNDTSDPVNMLPGTYSGKTAYICQYD